MSLEENHSLVLHPHLVIKRLEAHVQIDNPFHETSVNVPTTFFNLFDRIKLPKTISEIRIECGATDDILQALIENHILVRQDELYFLQGGLLNKPDVNICSYHDISVIAKDKSAANAFVLLGLPVDFLATGESGARHGPTLIRSYLTKTLGKTLAGPPVSSTVSAPSNEGLELLYLDLRRKYFLEKLKVFDIGNIFTWAEPIENIGQRTMKVINHIVKSGLRPLTMGGDHSISFFPLEVLLAHYPKMGIIHFDAHTDLYAYSPDMKLTHANPFCFALEHESLEVLMQIGPRANQFISNKSKPKPDSRIKYVSSMELRHMTPQEVFANLPQDIPYYISFDVDCMSPALVQETGTRSLGGLDYYQGLELIDYISEHFNLVGADFVEVAGSNLNGAKDQNTAAWVTAAYIQKIILGKVPFEPITNYYYVEDLLK